MSHKVRGSAEAYLLEILFQSHLSLCLYDHIFDQSLVLLQFKVVYFAEGEPELSL